MRCVDTTFLIDLLRNDPKAVDKSQELESDPIVYTTEANVFEVVSGIFAQATNKEKALHDAEQLFHTLRILPIDHLSAVTSGKISGFLMQKGIEIDPVDCLIAGTLLINGCTSIITRNVRHFSRIPGLKVESY